MIITHFTPGAVLCVCVCVRCVGGGLLTDDRRAVREVVEVFCVMLLPNPPNCSRREVAMYGFSIDLLETRKLVWLSPHFQCRFPQFFAQPKDCCLRLQRAAAIAKINHGGRERNLASR